MASSALTADRRWASSRKSGMTVLGKVPKPINLPSQRLENNGLDPTVEIVPKGTITWGNRPSSAATNAWSSSTLLSPKADGSAGSPRHNGRPSSGGSGTRPSTAGSDKSQDSCSWGPASRPSTASSVLVSSHISVTATRPRSAETRPGSSQLSRFAENSGENVTSWGTKGMPEKLGSTSLKSSGFTLSSGDFPTLGSEKNSESHSQRGHSLQGRPTSGSGRDVTLKENEGPTDGDCNLLASHEHGDTNTLNTEKSSHVGSGSQPDANWYREPKQSQPYNLNMAPHHFDSWRAPLTRPPDGMWPRVGAPGGPYRPGVATPGGFPVDPFVYYPQFQPNSEAALRPGAGQGGYHHKAGEAYNPHLRPNSYMVPGHPVLPAAPGIYPNPVPFDGYYGPPRANFCATDEREVPFMGVTNHPVLNRQANHNDKVDLGQFQRRSGKHDRPVPYEKIESDRAHGQYKVLLKQHDGSESSHGQERKDQTVTTHLSHPDGSMPAETTREAEKHIDSKKDQVPLKPEPDLKDTTVASSSWRGSPDNVTIDAQLKLSEANDGILSAKPQITSVIPDQPVIKKNASLIEKIEGLNNKARSSHIQSEAGHLSSREDKAKFKVVNAKTDHAAKAVCSNVFQAEEAVRTNPISCEVNLTDVENSEKVPTDSKVTLGTTDSQVTEVGKSASLKPEVTHSLAHKRANARRGTSDHPAKPISNILAGDDLTKERPERGPLTIPSPGLSGPYNQFSHESTLKDSHSSIVGETHVSPLDSVDYNAQRAKLKEIAAQRAEQLQKEEEERTREQKAKALAKLEELNRRSIQSVKKMNDALPESDKQHTQGSRASTDVKAGMLTNKSLDGNLAENFDVSVHTNDTEAKDVAAADLLGSEVTSQEYMVPHHLSDTHEQQSDTTASVTHRSISHSLDSNTSVSRHKQTSYRKRQNILQGKLPGEKPTVTGNMDNTKSFVEVDARASTNDGIFHHDDISVQHKKRGSRNSRYKNKVDYITVSQSLPSLATEEKCEKGASDDMKIHPSAPAAETIIVLPESSRKTMGSQSLADVVVRTTDQVLSEVTEEGHVKMSNHWKSQPSRRSASQQLPRPGDRSQGSESAIWAPAKQSNKKEQSEEDNHNVVDVPSNQSSGKNENYLHNVMKSKRAEMERYIPKPVAKELLQQESSQQPSSREQAVSFHTSVKPNVDINIPDQGKVDGSTVGKSESIADAKIGEDNKPTRRGRMHTSWRQRSSAESSTSFSEHPVSCNTAEHVQKLSDQHQPKSSGLPEKHPKSDDWTTIDANSMPTEPVTAHAPFRDQGTVSRQRQEQIKVHKVARNNSAVRDKNMGSRTDDYSYIQSPSCDSNQAELRNASKLLNKNSGSDHTRPHWKPKSHSYSQSHQKGSGSNDGQRIVSHGDVVDKELSSQGYESTAIDKDTNDITNEGCHQEDIVDKKFAVDSAKEHIHVVDDDVSGKATSEIEAQHDQVSHAPNRRGQLKNGRFPRGQEVIYRGRESRQDFKQNLGTNGEKRKNNIRLEYQPVGSRNKPNESLQQKSNAEEMQDGNPYSGPRHREQGQNHSRRSGHFVKRSSGPVGGVGDSHGGEWKSGHVNLEQ